MSLRVVMQTLCNSAIVLYGIILFHFMFLVDHQVIVFGALYTPSPDFLPAPANVTFHKGELAVLRCTVFNLGTKNVLWRRFEDSFPLTVGPMTVVSDDRLQVGHVDYKSQWDLMIKNVQPKDEGIYECQVASTDRTMRRLVYLTVLDPETETPEIQITGSQFVEKGDRIVLQCNATGEYYPPDEMDWFRNGERISSQRHRGVRISKQYSISKRTFTSVLVIDRANMHDDGTYVCRSSNMQITSTKVHVLNAETFNRKRGTVHDEKNDKQTSKYKKHSGTSTKRPLKTFIFILSTFIAFISL